MQQSNLYIVFYTAALTVICGLTLALAALGLKPYQDDNILQEKKQNILATVMKVNNRQEAKELYDKRVKSYVIDNEGKIIDGLVAENLVVGAEYKKPAKERKLPVYEIINENNPDKADFYVFPIYGFGLWNNIWGYISLKGDLNTINGVKFEHAGETPGLGARIASEEIQKRFVGKEVFEQEKLVSVQMMKGEGNDFSSDKHKVDGMSGATITGKGVNQMMLEYLACYEKFIKAKNQKKS